MIDISSQSIVNPDVVFVARQDELFVIQENSEVLICTIDFNNPEINALNATVEMGPDTSYNLDFGGSWVMDVPGVSFIKVDTTISALDTMKKCLLKLCRLSFLVTDGLLDSPISIFVNGNAVVCDSTPTNRPASIRN